VLTRRGLAAFGGAGTFDGVLLSGIVAVLLVAVARPITVTAARVQNAPWDTLVRP